MNMHTPVSSPLSEPTHPSIVNPDGTTLLPMSARARSDNEFDILLDGEPFAEATITGDGDEASLCLKLSVPESSATVIGAMTTALEAAFASSPELHTIAIAAESLQHAPLRALPFVALEGGRLTVSRSGFYQTPLLWLGHPQAGRTRAGLVAGPDGRDHPLRPPHPEGLVYQRYDPVANVTVSFRAVDIDRDLDTFHRWMNDGRVAFFWELARPKEDLRTYLEQLQAKPHTYPLIGCFDGQDAGYFETYWVREDRLGPYYESGPWDRGWHGLIGERRHLGRVKTGAWLRGLAHYFFLDCPMTENIMGEPRVDNAKLLTYADALAYEKVKEFDFPHKRSALMRCRRDRFFEEVRL
ncbi:GNAT family N-acetyltransferase [Roseibium sp.]|uniref:GNAT family N-acetyltransferase n=1 Tax=Roseibium sp. TaxID=1936156 RepID=UPI003A97B918